MFGVYVRTNGSSISVPNNFRKSAASTVSDEIYGGRDLATWIETGSQCNYAADYLGENKLANARGETKFATGQWQRQRQWHLRFWRPHRVPHIET